MRLAFLLVALAAAIQTTQAQTSGTILVQDNTYHGSYSGLMSSSFIGLKLPSGGGSVSITIAPGDLADNTYVSSFADHTQSDPYYEGGSSTTFTIGTAGHYWMYLAVQGTTQNYDWLEIRVEASTYSGTVNCYYCSPPSGWMNGYPPTGTPQLQGPPAPVHSQAGSPASSSSSRVPSWAIALLGVVIGLAVFVPASYLVYRRVKNNNAKAQRQGQVEMAEPTTVAV